jgi:hypothetical protein
MGKDRNLMPLVLAVLGGEESLLPLIISLLTLNQIFQKVNCAINPDS